MSDFRYFVGREESVTGLIGCAVGERRSSVWIHGPRRVGKSSLAAYLASRATGEGTRVIWVDAGDLNATDFNGLLDRAVKRGEAYVRVSGASPRERFEALASDSSSGPVLIVFDEFDHIAVNFQTYEQAYLRRLSQDYAMFCYIFITRLDPSFLVEEVSEQNSRLLAVCNHLRIKSLPVEAVHELCRKIGGDTGLPDFTSWADPIFERVGGYPYAVTWLAKEIVVAAQGGPLDYDIVLDVFDSHRRQIELDMQLHWTDLLPGTRALILQEASAQPDQANFADARADGYVTRARRAVRPQWLLEVGQRSGLAPATSVSGSSLSNAALSVEHLQRLVSAINAHLKRRGRSPGFEHSTQVFRYFWLTRPQVSRETVTRGVDHLARILLDGSRFPDGKKSRLPANLSRAFERSEGYTLLLELRRELTPGARRTVERDKRLSAEELYQRLCDSAQPKGADDWQAICDRLLEMLIHSLSELELMAREGASLNPACLLYVYATQDKDLCGQLDRHLSLLKQEGLIETIDACDISAGDEPERVWARNLERADILVLLLSSSFFSDPRCSELMRKTVDPNRRAAALPVPVYLRAFDIEPLRLDARHMLPKGGRPIISWEHRDEAWLSVAEDLRRLIEQRSRVGFDHPAQTPTSPAFERLW